MWWLVMVILTRVNVGGANNFAAGPLYGFTILFVSLFRIILQNSQSTQLLSQVIVFISVFYFTITGWTEDHRNFDTPCNFLICWEIRKSFFLLKVRGFRFCLVYRAWRLMAKWVRREWGKLGQVWKCCFYDTPPIYRLWQVRLRLNGTHCKIRGRRLDFGYERQFQHHMNCHGVGFQKIWKLKKIYRGTLIYCSLYIKPWFIVVCTSNSNFYLRR